MAVHLAQEGTSTTTMFELLCVFLPGEQGAMDVLLLYIPICSTVK